ncbi:hypothetical protein DERF_006528 [Dermatophagoides farinae]|uniref:Uncharacterized protein n=1 Tax=Dermatophagoides farinae TaxID=6954 RepID=A0A922I959_DERFA|nr:hypothetical protein DERF_006528 [Dermatophagoides farinae]
MHALDDEVAKFFISTKIISTFTNLCYNLKMVMVLKTGHHAMMMSMNLVNHTVIYCHYYSGCLWLFSLFLLLTFLAGHIMI